MKHEFEQIEDAAISALGPLRASGIVRTLDPYAGQLERDSLAKITMRFPCLYVIADGLSVIQRNTTDECSINFLVIAGDKSYRSGSAVVRGSSGSCGVYEILMQARKQLHRKKLLAGFPPAVLIKEETGIYNPSAGVCLYTAHYSIKGCLRL